MNRFLDGLDDDDFGAKPAAPAGAEAIRENAHITNGGEVATVVCPKCGGSGSWRGRGQCFACKGSGHLTNRQFGAQKAKVTRERNIDSWQEEHADLIASLRAISDWNNMAQSLLSDIEGYGTLTENKIKAAHTLLAKIAANREAKRAEKQAALPSGGKIDISRIEALFDKARASGLKRLAFRTKHITISVPKATSANAGGLYVKHDGEYAGKIMGGVFKPFNAKPDTLALVCEIAENPAERAKQYGIETGTCSCCGAELTDPVSIANGIGPICADNWGL